MIKIFTSIKILKNLAQPWWLPKICQKFFEGSTYIFYYKRDKSIAFWLSRHRIFYHSGIPIKEWFTVCEKRFANNRQVEKSK